MTSSRRLLPDGRWAHLPGSPRSPRAAPIRRPASGSSTTVNPDECTAGPSRRSRCRFRLVWGHPAAPGEGIVKFGSEIDVSQCCQLTYRYRSCAKPPETSLISRQKPRRLDGSAQRGYSPASSCNRPPVDSNPVRIRHGGGLAGCSIQGFLASQSTRAQSH